MQLIPRQKLLLDILNESTYCSNEELSENLNVSTQTIRRDIKILGEKGLLIKHHGGVSSVSSSTNLEYKIRQGVDIEIKNSIAKTISEAIPDDVTIFLSIGTTVEIVAKHLINKKGLKVFTNSFRVALILQENKNIEIFITAGHINLINGGISSNETIDYVGKFRFDYLISSAASIDTDGTLLEFDSAEAEVVKTIQKSAKNTFIALDSHKFTPKGAVEYTHISNITCLFSDQLPPKKIMDIIKKSNVSLTICS